jgi:hypothetical protein
MPPWHLSSASASCFLSTTNSLRIIFGFWNIPSHIQGLLDAFGPDHEALHERELKHLSEVRHIYSIALKSAF